MKERMILLCVGLLVGVILTNWLNGLQDKKLPEMFEIEKNGKVAGYADTDFSKSEFVNLSGKNIKNPGEFIAFPIYESKEF